MDKHIEEQQYILVKGLKSSYHSEHLVRIFYPGAAIRHTGSTKGELFYLRAGKKQLTVGFRLKGCCRIQKMPLNQLMEKFPDLPREKQLEAGLAEMLYLLLKEHTATRPPWGMLTGVRPVRLFRRVQQEYGLEKARDTFMTIRDVSPEKAIMAEEISARQSPVLDMSRKNSYSLYISIPFCPTRCAYCSFVSRTIEKEKRWIEPYLEALFKEMQNTAQVAQELGLKLETVYIGGGTPTALNVNQLERLLQAAEQYFTPAETREYTLEAGRPDCTDWDKLVLLKQYGVNRISINPQTFQDEVLQAIGRRHTTEDLLRCFEQARQAGHENINMDLIAGLPKDSIEGFITSAEQAIQLAPENITLHSLTMKRASNLVLEHTEGTSSPGRMIEEAYPRFKRAGYQPYYLYRQKQTLENLENTGWSMPGKQGLYNIFIMEEAHTILSVGAGGSTKLVADKGQKIQRYYNPKYPLDYIENFDSILDKKQGVKAFYAGNLDSQTFG